MENYANDAGREFGWDDEIQNDSPDLVLLPEGEYPFEVTKFERPRQREAAALRHGPADHSDRRRRKRPFRCHAPALPAYADGRSAVRIL